MYVYYRQRQKLPFGAPRPGWKSLSGAVSAEALDGRRRVSPYACEHGWECPRGRIAMFSRQAVTGRLGEPKRRFRKYEGGDPSLRSAGCPVTKRDGGPGLTCAIGSNPVMPGWVLAVPARRDRIGYNAWYLGGVVIRLAGVVIRLSCRSCYWRRRPPGPSLFSAAHSRVHRWMGNTGTHMGASAFARPGLRRTRPA